MSRLVGVAWVIGGLLAASAFVLVILWVLFDIIVVVVSPHFLLAGFLIFGLAMAILLILGGVGEMLSEDEEEEELEEPA